MPKDSLDNVLSELQSHRKSIAKLGDALKKDKAKADAVKQIDDIISEMKPLAAKMKELEKQVEAAKKLGDELKSFNQKLGALNTDANKALGPIGALRGKDDTPQRDFSSIWVALQKLPQSLDGP